MNFTQKPYLIPFAGLLLVLTVSPLLNAQNEGGVPSSIAQVNDLDLIDDLDKSFVKLFDGTTLEGWEQKNGSATYEVVDGTIMGRTAVNSPNSFLCSKEEYENFDLRFEVKVDEGLNSGVQIRSVSKPSFKKGRVHGPQVEIETGPAEAGYIYSEGTGRGWISPTQTKHDYFKNDGWNRYRVLADGARVQTWINDNMVEDLILPEIEPRKGFFGLQVHGVKERGPYKVQWRNISVKVLDGTEQRTHKAVMGTPVIDGKVDDIWKDVPRAFTTREIAEHDQLPDGEAASTAEFKCMWDDGHLYCLAIVKDSKISTTAGEDYERDSVEFFVDVNNEATTSYDSDDAQYRTDAAGAESAGESSDADNYTSKVTKTDDGYIVEACIKLETAAGKKIGFDVQVNNDAGGGYRQSTTKWNDSTNESWQDASGFGTLELAPKK